MTSKIAKLRDLTTKPATAEHKEEYDKQTSAKADDRSFCLLLTAMLENELDRAIDHWFGGLSEKLRHDMYDHDGPLGNFSRKITLASALEIIGLPRRRTSGLFAMSAMHSLTPKSRLHSRRRRYR